MVNRPHVLDRQLAACNGTMISNRSVSERTTPLESQNTGAYAGVPHRQRHEHRAAPAVRLQQVEDLQIVLKVAGTACNFDGFNWKPRQTAVDSAQGRSVFVVVIGNDDLRRCKFLE